VRSVTSGNASISSGAEVIDLARYTGVPGLIDAHTHIMWYWDGITGRLSRHFLETRGPEDSSDGLTFRYRTQ
jgi:cytosine/adenosine deaminase-related metal-dependent hydrolase